MHAGAVALLRGSAEVHALRCTRGCAGSLHVARKKGHRSLTLMVRPTYCSS